MKPSQAAIDWAAKMRFSALVSNQTIIEAYEAHKRLLVKIAARQKRPNVCYGAEPRPNLPTAG